MVPWGSLRYLMVLYGSIGFLLDLELYFCDNCHTEKMIMIVVHFLRDFSFVLCFNCTRFKFVALQINHKCGYSIIKFYLDNVPSLYIHTKMILSNTIPK